MEQLAMEQFDIAVVGAGVVGSAIAMELSRYQLRVALLEAKTDVGAGTSKANSAILHTGFDAPVGSIEVQLVKRGYALYHQWSDPLGLPIGRTGALLIAWNDEQAAAIPAILEKAAKNGVGDLREISLDDLRRLEPHLGPGAVRAVVVPGESITCPFTPVLAFATNAVRNGVTLRREFPVESVQSAGDAWILSGPAGRLQASIVVNAAGLESDTLDRLFGKTRFTVRPRKGEFLVYDKPAGVMIRHVLLPVPVARTKGVLLAPTVFGNLLLGPTAVDQDDRTDVSVSQAGIRSLTETGYRILPALRHEDVTTTYAGLRAATEHQDYQIHFYPQERYATVGGIRSTGLSGSLGIAEYVTERLLSDYGLPATRNTAWQPYRMPPITNLSPRTCEDAARIERNPTYGAIICHCEAVSRGEVMDALHSDIPAHDLDGIKRRTRAMMGRCQGFNCSVPIRRMVGRP